MGILGDICKDYNIPIVSLTDEILNLITSNSEKGTHGTAYAISIPEDGVPNYKILIDNKAGLQERRLMVAHELAHILFGHLTEYCVLKDEDRELEACIFAGVFTALILFKEYGGFQAEVA